MAAAASSVVIPSRRWIPFENQNSQPPLQNGASTLTPITFCSYNILSDKKAELETWYPENPLLYTDGQNGRKAVILETIRMADVIGCQEVEPSVFEGLEKELDGDYSCFFRMPVNIVNAVCGLALFVKTGKGITVVEDGVSSEDVEDSMVLKASLRISSSQDPANEGEHLLNVYTVHMCGGKSDAEERKREAHMKSLCEEKILLNATGSTVILIDSNGERKVAKNEGLEPYWYRYVEKTLLGGGGFSDTQIALPYTTWKRRSSTVSGVRYYYSKHQTLSLLSLSLLSSGETFPRSQRSDVWTTFSYEVLVCAVKCLTSHEARRGKLQRTTCPTSPTYRITFPSLHKLNSNRRSCTRTKLEEKIQIQNSKLVADTQQEDCSFLLFCSLNFRLF